MVALNKGAMAALAALSTLTIGGATIYSNSFTTETKEEVEPITFQVVTNEDNTKREGTTEVQQEGKNGSKKVTYAVTYRDGKEVKREKQSEDVIEEAQAKIVVKGTKKYYTCSNGTEYETVTEKQECENRIQWEATKASRLQECYNDSSKTNCWYDEYPGTVLHWTDYVAPSTYTAPSSTHTAPKTSKYGRTGAICRDGWQSSATGSGACSHHSGVSYWLY